VRQELGGWADRVGARKAVARGRDRLVDLLNGDRSSPVARRNRKDDFHLKLLLRFGLRARSNCLEVGANQGIFLRDIRRVAPGGHHIAYEPIPGLYEKLTREFPTVEVRQRALSDRDGLTQFVHVLDPGMQGLSGLLDHRTPDSDPGGTRTEVFTVATERLDGHVPDGWLPDFVKIDVEGAEQLVLEGAVETLRRAKPVIAFEHGFRAGASEEIYKLLCQDVGLRLFDMDGNGPFDLPGFLDALSTRWNWVAHE
jgi:FkbM family methyltransferase